jgi:hypothetical protein
LCWYFWDRVLWTLCHSWLRTLILLISASWVRITGMNYWCLAPSGLFFFKFNFIIFTLTSVYIIICTTSPTPLPDRTFSYQSFRHHSYWKNQN